MNRQHERTAVDEITPLVLTLNEAANIERTLGPLFWAKRIVVIDSFSTDETLAIISRFPQVEVIQRQFDTFAGQCNFGLAQISSEWVLSLDADYVLSDALVQEIQMLEPPEDVAAYRASFQYRIFGKPLRGSLYLPRNVLYRRARARYHDDGHGHRVEIDGRVEPLRNCIFHDDRKPLSAFISGQNRYAKLEAEKLTMTFGNQLGLHDRIRQKVIFAPFLTFLFYMFRKGLIFDGWAGLHYTLQRTLFDVLLSLRLVEKKLEQLRGTENRPSESVPRIAKVADSSEKVLRTRIP